MGLAMRAFLSHSSTDNELVRAVAKELGRQHCVFDEQAFDSGEDFLAAIDRGLEQSATIVLFASRAALESMWVRQEIEKARERTMLGAMHGAQVFLIDGSVTVSDLPAWVQRAKVTRETAPKTIARAIQRHLQRQVVDKQKRVFVGRGDATEAFERALTPTDGRRPPRIVFVRGLPGVGRRTLTRRVAQNLLSLPEHVTVVVPEDASAQDVCLLVADFVEPYSTLEGLQRLAVEIRALSDVQATARTLELLRQASRSRELPIFVDEGGILDPNGALRPPIDALACALNSNDEAYIALIVTRKPSREVSIGPVVTVRELTTAETRRLITTLCSDARLPATPDEVGELAEYVRGYPPAAYYAVEEAKDYGLQLVLDDKGKLVTFRRDRFLSLVQRTIASEAERGLVRILGTFSPLPWKALAGAVGRPAELQQALRKLLDCSIVTVTDEGFYSIAEPLADAAVYVAGLPSADQARAVADELAVYLEEISDQAGLLTLSRVRFRAARLAGQGVEASVDHLASDLTWLAEQHYRSRDYELAIKCAREALAERPKSVKARQCLIRALVNEERWGEAETELARFSKYAAERDTAYHWGFLERKRGNLAGAIEHYLDAESKGARSISVYRDLASCYYEIRDLPNAARYIRIAIDRGAENRYVVDLWAQIATAQGDEPGARKALKQLQVVDEPGYYYHRLARVEMAFGNYAEARLAAERAVGAGKNRPPFEALATLAILQIKEHDLEAAEMTISTIDRRFPKTRSDIRNGLGARLLVAKGAYSGAVAKLDKIQDKTTVFYKKLRRDAIAGEVKNGGLPAQLRDRMKNELNELAYELTDVQEKDTLLP